MPFRPTSQEPLLLPGFDDRCSLSGKSRFHSPEPSFLLQVTRRAAAGEIVRYTAKNQYLSASGMKMLVCSVNSR